MPKTTYKNPLEYLGKELHCHSAEGLFFSAHVELSSWTWIVLTEQRSNYNNGDVNVNLRGHLDTNARPFKALHKYAIHIKSFMGFITPGAIRKCHNNNNDTLIYLSSHTHLRSRQDTQTERHTSVSSFRSNNIKPAFHFTK